MSKYKKDMKIPKGEMIPAPEKCPRCGKKSIQVKYDKENDKLIHSYNCSSCFYVFIPGTEI
ncbi:MAG: hypothetical protein Q7R52_03710 [archaeon]|nr:hypothetical protein [archaeon]